MNYEPDLRPGFDLDQKLKYCFGAAVRRSAAATGRGNGDAR